jgi:MFS family permease
MQDEDKRNPSTRTAPEAWWMLAVLFLFYVMSYLDRYIFTMLVGPIKADLNLTDFEMSLLLGPAFAIFYGVFGLPLGWAADRYPRRWVIFVGVICWSIATMASGLARTFGALLAARAGVGVGEAALSPSAYSLMADKFPRERLTTAMSIYQTGVKVGSAAAFGLGGLAIHFAEEMRGFNILGFGTAEPWHMVLFMVGAPGLILSLLVFTFSEPPRAAARKHHAEPGDLIPFIRTNRDLLLRLLIAFSLLSVCSNGLTAWVPSFIERRFGMEPIEYGSALSLISVVAAGGLVLKGAIVDHLYQRGMRDAHIRFYSWLLISMVPLVLTIFLLNNAIVFLVLYGIVQLIAVPFVVYQAATVSLIAPPHLRGRLAAIFLFSYTMTGLGAGPMLIAGLTDFVLRDEAKIGISLLITVSACFLIAFFVLRSSLKPLNEALDQVSTDRP